MPQPARFNHRRGSLSRPASSDSAAQRSAIAARLWIGRNESTWGSIARMPLARAAMEGVTMGMNYGLRRLATLGVKAKEIRLTGGGAKSAVWRQIMADVFGVPVVGMVEDEGAALGGALQAVVYGTADAAVGHGLGNNEVNIQLV